MTSEPTNAEGDMETCQTLMEFPCEFPLKVFGRDGKQLEQITTAIICEHVIHAEITEIKAKLSKTGKYTALTLTFTVYSKRQLDLIYLALSNHDTVVMTL
jgi:putative lipoic acid-binding regulatory protein